MRVSGGEQYSGQRGAYFVEAIEHLDGRRPVNTGVGDRDTVLESLRTLWRDILAAAVDVRLDHHTGDSIIAGTELFADVVDDLGLVVVVLLRVAVCEDCLVHLSILGTLLQLLTAAVNHDRGVVVGASLGNGSGGSLDVLSSEVGATAAATEDNVDVLVAAGLYNSGEAVLGDAHESMRVGGRAHSIDRNTDLDGTS